jgi:hypothetical protein
LVVPDSYSANLMFSIYTTQVPTAVPTTHHSDQIAFQVMEAPGYIYITFYDKQVKKRRVLFSGMRSCVHWKKFISISGEHTSLTFSGIQWDCMASHPRRLYSARSPLRQPKNQQCQETHAQCCNSDTPALFLRLHFRNTFCSITSKIVRGDSLDELSN